VKLQSNLSVEPAYLPSPAGPYVIPESDGASSVDLSLILPTFNESKNIRTALQLVAGTLRNVDGLNFEIIVVDDNSPDLTYQLALDESLNVPEVRVIRRTAEHGLATAVIRGWQAARGNILGVMDADLQHPPSVLAELVSAVQGSSDLAVASRHVEKGGVSDWSLIRRIISRTAQLLGLILLPEVLGRVNDPMSGYFLLRRQVIAGKHLNPTGYKILIEVIALGKVGKLSEIGYVFRERQEGESKVSASVYLQYVQHLLRLRIVLLRNSRFLRFCLVGLSGVAVDMSLLFLLSDPAMLAWGLTRSKILAAEAAIVNNFIWNDAWTFRDLVGSDSSLRSKFYRFLKFNAICLIGLFLNVTLLNVLFNSFGMNRYVANVIAILAATFWNFGVNKRLGWRSTNLKG
jgi:dolichol-phosphate mannosyltransferase